MKYNTERVVYNPTLESFMLGELVFDVRGLYAYLARLTDQRDPRGVRYGLADALTLIILAKMGGEDGPQGMAEWLQQRAEVLASALQLPRPRMPHRLTISRILGEAVEVEELDKLLATYFDPQVQGSREVVIAFDGKTLRGTIEPGQGQGEHLLAAYLPGEGVALMQLAVGDKENEIVVALKLIEALDFFLINRCGSFLAPAPRRCCRRAVRHHRCASAGWR
jgi:hypothetical protein